MGSITKGDYTLRRMLPSQWEDYRKIRLEALSSNPEMFGSNYTKEAAYSREEWISLLENESRAIFALYYHDSLIGLTGVVLDRDDESTAILIASFIKTPHRGRGLSSLFYQVRIDWARQKKCKAIVVSHRAGNEPSKLANQRFGFKYDYTRKVLWPDGVSADELMYSLKL
jgi:RimJ/RimL family protein N-acetyltransferase